MRFTIIPVLLGFALTACGSPDSEGAIGVGIIGDQGSLSDSSPRLSSAGQHLRAATTQGLVALDAAGQVVPALAERWIITDGGKSYIFRLRSANWSSGQTITSPQIRLALLETIGRYKRTSLGLDLAKIADIRSMTGRVIEISLISPMPDLLKLLAQPEMGLKYEGKPSGPMKLVKRDSKSTVTLAPMPPQERGFPAIDGWEKHARQLVLRAMPARSAVDGFTSGQIDLVLNGQLANFPLAKLAPLSRGTVRLDATGGLLGFVARNKSGLLSTAGTREAVAMAIDRENLMQPFNIDGWKSSTWPVPRSAFAQGGPAQENWANLSMRQRREVATRRIESWKAGHRGSANLSVKLPPGLGSDQLFARLAADLRKVGISATRAAAGKRADLELIDRVARYDSARWYLDQFNCKLRAGPCSPEADGLVAQSIRAEDQQVEQAMLAQANEILGATHIYIPLGAPIRWSLVRGTVAAYAENAQGLHPLFPLTVPTI